MLRTLSRSQAGIRPVVSRPECLAWFVLCLAVNALGPLATAQSPGLRQGSKKDQNPFESPKPGLVDKTRSMMPEGLAMLVEILGDGQVKPGRGWCEKGISRTRFGWDSVSGRLDRNHDGTIAREEYPGLEADYHTLDRDRNGKLTPFDFEFPTNALARSRSRMIMSFADRNKDGKVAGDEYTGMMYQGTRDDYTRQRYFSDAIDEVAEIFKDNERRGIPFLGLSDLRETVDLAAWKKVLEVIPDPDGDIEVTTRATLLRALVRRELGSLHAGPSPGEKAPDFTLPTVDGRGRVTLSKLLGSKPVVLVFASTTDFAFRSEAGSLEKLFRRYRDRAEFLLVYVREGRPSDGWASKQNTPGGFSIAQPKDERSRAKAAQDCRRKLGLGWPMVVDGMDDRVGILYSGMPDRIYLLDARGEVAYQSGRGPFGFKPDEVEQSLILLLQAGLAPTAAR